MKLKMTIGDLVRADSAPISHRFCCANSSASLPKSAIPSRFYPTEERVYWCDTCGELRSIMVRGNKKDHRRIETYSDDISFRDQ